MKRIPTPWYWRIHYGVLFLYVAFALMPLIWMLKVSLTPDELLYGDGAQLLPSRLTFSHYLSVLEHTEFPLYFRNSVIVSVATAVLAGALAAAAGYGFSRFRFRAKSWIIGLMLATQMFPLVMIVAPVFRLLALLGLTNTLTGLVIVYTAFNLPFATFLMQSFIDAVPRDLEEAAMLDGATRFGAAARIVLPLILPGIAATLAFIFTAAWSELLFALMLNSASAASTLPVGLLAFISKFSVDYGQMMAAGMLALLPVCVFFFFMQRFLVQGLTAGAMKG